MKCGWSKLDKIETDYEKVNLKNDGPCFFNHISSVQNRTQSYARLWNRTGLGFF